jgi:hypothetical protein
MKRFFLAMMAIFSWLAVGIWLADLFLKERISYGLAQLIISVLFVILALFILYLIELGKDRKDG